MVTQPVRLGLGILVAMLPACGNPVSSSELRSLEEGARLWAARGYQDYSFEVRFECFCPPSLRDWARVEVVGGEVQRVVLLTTAAPVTDERLQWWPTIEKLFDDLRQANEGENSWLADVRFTLDPGLGYPTRISWLAKPGVQDADLVLFLQNPRQLVLPPG